MIKNILITGGAGYIGSHTLIELHNAGYDFIVYDNLSNSSQEALKRVSKIISKEIVFEEGDIRDSDTLMKIFEKYNIDSVIHFAGLKSVGESVENPLSYYDNNVVGTLKLLEVMQKFGCKKMVFSSSATVYNEVDAKNYIPLTESNPTGNTTNPYGTSKYMIEQILNDLFISDNSFKIAILRYFNPVGAHESGLIGEDPTGLPNNLMPFITQTALGKRDELKIFGNDYKTEDGTAVRDYIHVVDLAKAHVLALQRLIKSEVNENFEIFNIGTGIGYSVLDVIASFEKTTKQKLNYSFAARREGDVPVLYASTSKASEELNWNPTLTLDDMTKSSWEWEKKGNI